jgi:hypothetical protein
MSLALVLFLAALVGLAVGRWWLVLSLGLFAGGSVLAIGAWSGTTLNDTPAAFVALVVAIGASIGMALRRLRHLRST